MKKLFKAVFSIIGIGFIGFVIMGIYGGNLQNNRKKWVEKNRTPEVIEAFRKAAEDFEGD